MNKRPRASLLLTPTYAGMGLSAQEKTQHFLAFIPIPSEARNRFSPYCHPRPDRGSRVFILCLGLFLSS